MTASSSRLLTQAKVSSTIDDSMDATRSISGDHILNLAKTATDSVGGGVRVQEICVRYAYACRRASYCNALTMCESQSPTTKGSPCRGETDTNHYHRRFIMCGISYEAIALRDLVTEATRYLSG